MVHNSIGSNTLVVWQIGSWFLIAITLLSFFTLLMGLGIKTYSSFNGLAEVEGLGLAIVLSFCCTWIAPALWVVLGVFTHQIESKTSRNG